MYCTLLPFTSYAFPKSLHPLSTPPALLVFPADSSYPGDRSNPTVTGYQGPLPDYHLAAFNAPFGTRPACLPTHHTTISFIHPFSGESVLIRENPCKFLGDNLICFVRGILVNFTHAPLYTQLTNLVYFISLFLPPPLRNSMYIS